MGSTSYLNVSVEHKAIEIGFIFLTPIAQRGFVNRRCKLLLLTHAFQTHKNKRSRADIVAIGATFEGVHRDCRIQENCSIRSSVFYKIIKSEWPETKCKLLAKLTHPTIEKR